MPIDWTKIAVKASSVPEAVVGMRADTILTFAQQAASMIFGSSDSGRRGKMNAFDTRLFAGKSAAYSGWFGTKKTWATSLPSAELQKIARRAALDLTEVPASEIPELREKINDVKQELSRRGEQLSGFGFMQCKCGLKPPQLVGMSCEAFCKGR